MFISKKKFNMMLEEAALKRESELDTRRQIDDKFRYIQDDMDNSFRYVRSDMRDLEERISKIEKELHPELEKKRCCEIQAVNVPCKKIF